MARVRLIDPIARAVTAMFGLLLVAVTAGIAYQLWATSLLGRQRFGFSFLTSSIWDPVTLMFGAAPFIYGTLVTSGLALLIAVPLGLAVAIFLAELAPPRVSSIAGLLVELLAAVPSVIYGLVGVSVLVPIMRVWIEPALASTLGWLPLFSGQIYGIGYLTAGLVLAIMIVPFIVAVSREVLLAVPREQREAALALGATKWEGVSQIVVPYARSGIYGAIFLALGRALGETMAVTMVIGNRPEIAASLFAPGYSMAAVIANEFTEATDEVHLQVLVEIGLVLFALTMVINGLARVLIGATASKGAE